MEQFKSPPIQEALLDIQVTLPPDMKLEALKRFHEGFESRFPEVQERFPGSKDFRFHDTLFEFSPWRFAAHPAYQRTIGLGWRVVPIILQQLAREADFWFVEALSL